MINLTLGRFFAMSYRRELPKTSAGATAGAQAAQAQMIDSESETTEVRAQMIDGTSDVAIA